MKKFACHTVIPGCDRVFTGAGDQSVLDQVLKHAAADHPQVEPSLPFIELVMSHTHPVLPTRHGRHLRIAGGEGRLETAAGSAPKTFRAVLPELGPPATTITFDPSNPGHIDRILRSGSTAGLPVARTVKLAVAVDEIAVVGYRHTGQVIIRLWPDRAGVICEITDAGTVDASMIARTIGITADSPRDRAIGLANELCDLVQISSDSTGTTTRLHSRREPLIHGATSAQPEPIRDITNGPSRTRVSDHPTRSPAQASRHPSA